MAAARWCAAAGRRLAEALRCRRRRYLDGDEYVLLEPAPQESEVVVFAADYFQHLGIGRADMEECSRDQAVARHLQRLLPLYRQCLRRQECLGRVLQSAQCRPAVRLAAEVEKRKSERIMETLDLMVLKLVIGEFAIHDTEGLDSLLEKFAADQNTLCEMERIVQLIDLDREQSERLLDSEAYASLEAEGVERDLSALPALPRDAPGGAWEEAPLANGGEPAGRASDKSAVLAV